MMTTRMLVAVCTAASLLTLPAVATAAIVPGKSIAGAALGMDISKVDKKLGPAIKVVNHSAEEPGVEGFNVLEATYEKGYVVWYRPAKRGTAALITTTATNQKTAAGAGVGSTAAAVKKKHPKAKCKPKVCTLGDIGKVGARYTEFTLKAGKVTRVGVGIAQP